MTDSDILVVGGTGRTGSRVARRLRERGARVRIASRRGSPAFDWNRPDGWPPLLDGAGAAFICFSPDLAAPGALEAITRFTAEAVAAGVRRLVLLSGRGEEAALACEEALARTAGSAAVTWTVVRSAFFMENFTEGLFAPAVAAGEIAVPGAHTPEPFVSLDDVADVAVAALLGLRGPDTAPHEHAVHEVTGPRALTFGEAARLLSAARGHAIDVVDLPVAAWSAAAASGGMPREEADFLGTLLGQLLDGRNTATTDGVERALGRPPRDFESFVASSTP